MAPLVSSGKTTFETIVKLMTQDCIIFSTIDPIKEIAERFIWNGEKDAKGRKLLSDLKRLFVEYDNNYIMNYIDNTLYPQRANVIFIDSREPEEIKNICEKFDAKSILVRRPSIEGAPTSNSSDANVFNYDYDIVIMNDGEKRDLIEAAAEFLKAEGIPIKPYYINLFGELDV